MRYDSCAVFHLLSQQLFFFTNSDYKTQQIKSDSALKTQPVKNQDNTADYIIP